MDIIKHFGLRYQKLDKDTDGEEGLCSRCRGCACRRKGETVSVSDTVVTDDLELKTLEKDSQPDPEIGLRVKDEYAKNRTVTNVASSYIEPSGWKVEAMEVFSAAGKRTSVLVVLLLLQSLSGFVLEGFRRNLMDDPSYTFMTLFLTMLVGAGGNAGNQSAVFVICGIATGDVVRIGATRLILKELSIGVLEAVALCLVATGRVMAFDSTYGMVGALAIVSSLALIVITSVVLGTILPFMLWRLKMDPAHAGPLIQVVMDIAGVTIACGFVAVLLN